MEPAKVGDKIKACGQIVTIGEIISQDYWGEGRGGWYIEFKDKKGMYRYWKQQYDGGELIRA